jgi:hypothetical protein
MKKLLLALLSLVTALTTGSVVLADKTDDLATLKQISNYRQWTRVNRQPIVVPEVSLLG